tara:strand:+ start:3864 stop:4232 length:369 start_codon:yes stop_codon:yes gene_type:complete
MMNPFRYVSPKEMACRVLIGAVIIGLFIVQVIITTNFMSPVTPNARRITFNMRAVLKVSAIGVLAVNSALSSNSVPGSMMLLTAFAITSAPPMSVITSGYGNYGSGSDPYEPPNGPAQIIGS